jgi:hypothetical protein
MNTNELRRLVERKTQAVQLLEELLYSGLAKLDHDFRSDFG